MKTLNHSTYTILIPDKPTAMAVYCHCEGALPHSNGKKGKTIYNYQEEIAEKISESSPEAIVAVATSNVKALRPKLKELKEKYGIKNAVVGGWSLGGNNALRVASDLGANVILMDCNHTNQVDSATFKKLSGKSCVYVSNNKNATKFRNIDKVSKSMVVDYRLITIPKNLKVSYHRYCRDYALENGIYEELIRQSCDIAEQLLQKLQQLKEQL